MQQAVREHLKLEIDRRTRERIRNGARPGRAELATEAIKPWCEAATGPNGVLNICTNHALPGSRYCGVHSALEDEDS